MFIEIEKIQVDERIRQNLGSESEWKDFLESFKKRGQLQAIRVQKEEDGTYRLIAGERRLRALAQLHKEGIIIPGVPPGTIEATVRDPVATRERLLQEFAENLERKEFDHVERARFIRRFHEEMLAVTENTWTQELTAYALNLSKGSISQYLRVEEAIKNDPTVAKASTLRAAVKRMRVQETLANRHEEAKLDKAVFDRATMLLHKGDAREWLKTIPDNSVDLVNFDPPWGDNVSHKVDPEFDDSTEYAQSLMDACLPEIYRVLKNDRFCIFWHRSWITETMRSYAHSFGFNTTNTKTACIWYKPEKISDENRIPEKQLIEAYEPFYLLRKGDPIFYERMANNVFAYNRVSLGALIHPTEKPLELCSDLIRLTTVPGEVVLDPTAGSSAFLEAALRSSRKAKGCELSNKYYERGITRLAEYLKTYKEN